MNALSQCLIIHETEDTKDITYDPSLANEGFSLSLWIKSDYTEEEFFNAELFNSYPEECFVSTGKRYISFGRWKESEDEGEVMVVVVVTERGREMSFICEV